MKPPEMPNYGLEVINRGSRSWIAVVDLDQPEDSDYRVKVQIQTTENGQPRPLKALLDALSLYGFTVIHINQALGSQSGD